MSAGMKENRYYQFVCKVCKDNQFKKRGRAFFRIVGDGILQVLKYTSRRSPWYVEGVLIGLFSMYDELREEWFTERGCIPSYSYFFLKTPAWEYYTPYCEAVKNQKQFHIDGLNSEGIFTFHFDEDCFENVTIPFLNEMKTQTDFLCAMNHLDYMSSKVKPQSEEAAAWSQDFLRYGAFLFNGDGERAAAIYRHYLDILMKNAPNSSERAQLQKEAASFTEKIQLAESGDDCKIKTWLQKNYDRNIALSKGIPAV